MDGAYELSDECSGDAGIALNSINQGAVLGKMII